MRKEEKTQIIESLAAQLEKTPNFYLADISGLNAEKTALLRRTCFEKEIKLVVVKNTLLRKALEKRGIEEVELLFPILEGPSAVMFTEVANTPAKLIKEFGKKHGIQVLLNPAPALRELDMSYACKCDFFVPNETELEILTGMPVNTYENICLAARSLVEKGLNNIIVTMGEKGALWMTRDREVKVPACKVNAVDTSGAGDAFIGCFAHYYVQSGDVEAAMKKASLFAAFSRWFRRRFLFHLFTGGIAALLQ